MSFGDLISEIRQKGNDGKDFEVFCKWFLLNDPYWKTQVDEVWLWDDWPQRWDRDKGFDLVFRHKNGEVWAVQSKCYAETTRITKEDVDSFLTDSNRKIISKRLLMASTNALGRNAIETMAGQEKPVVRWMLDDFENSAIVYPQALSELNKSAETKEHEDRPYQLEAVEAVVEGLNNHDRGQLIMACGTGKTFVTLWIKERLKSQTCLVLLPSLSLLSQTLHEWTANCKDEFEVLCVCSDATVGKRDTYEDLRISEAPFDVASNPDVIKAFLNLQQPKVVFCTYQSSELIGKAQGRNIIDLVVCDEAHRCAGSATASFTKVLDNKFIKAKKRLFTTATPRVFSKATVKSADARGHQIYGMDDETVFGPVLHTYSFGQAIEDKWLTDYQVLIVGVDEPTIQSYIEIRAIVGSAEAGIVSDAETLAAKLSLLKATAEYDLKRVISFHSRVKATKEFSSEYCDLIDLVEPSKRPDGVIWTDFVSGEMSAGDRKQKIQRLKNLLPNERGLLANARCLSEGVDVPSLDGVAFIDPKGSQIDIIQAVGRALRKSDEKKFGTIILPVFIEPGDNEIERIENSNFKPVWDVLKALRSHDERLGESIDGIRTELGKRQKSREPLPDNIIFDLPVNVGAEFSESLQTRLIESVSASWHYWFGMLEAYAEENGHARPTQATKIGSYKLGNWVINLRMRPERLNSEQIEALEKLPGWAWDTREAQWEEGFSELEKFVALNKTASVHSTFETPSGYKLGSWVGNQRNKKFTHLTNSQIKRLESLRGWSWNTQKDKWDNFIKNLKMFLNKEGHLLVLYQHKTTDDFPLGLWVSRIRSRYYGKGAALNREEIEELEALDGWIWNHQEAEWTEKFQKLTEQLKKTPDLIFSRTFLKSIGQDELASWVQSQRTRYKRGSISECQITRLEKLPGWTWTIIDDAWERGFNCLKIFAAQYGHANPKGNFKTEDGFGLGVWCHSQKQKYKHSRGSITEDKIKRLEALPNWIWFVTETAWDRNFQLLEEFVSEFGHPRVPTYHKNKDGHKIGFWVANQRGKYKNDKVTKDQVAPLEALPGWVWDAIEVKWEEGFSQLEKFVRHYGHASPTPKFKDQDGFGLGMWVGRQRSLRNGIEQSKKTRLEALPGWVWHADEARWEEGFTELIAFYEKNKSTKVSSKYVAPSGYRLGQWLNHQLRVKDTMPKSRRKRLESIPKWAWAKDEMI